LVGDESGDVDKTGDIRRIASFGGQDNQRRNNSTSLRLAIGVF
jgi:hypothetical protein